MIFLVIKNHPDLIRFTLSDFDGAPWIRNQLAQFGGCDHIRLDYYHFSEHVAVAARQAQRATRKTPWKQWENAQPRDAARLWR